MKNIKILYLLPFLFLLFTSLKRNYHTSGFVPEKWIIAKIDSSGTSFDYSAISKFELSFYPFSCKKYPPGTNKKQIRNFKKRLYDGIINIKTSQRDTKQLDYCDIKAFYKSSLKEDDEFGSIWNNDFKVEENLHRLKGSNSWLYLFYFLNGTGNITRVTSEQLIIKITTYNSKPCDLVIYCFKE